MTDIETLIEFFENVDGKIRIPFKNSEMASAVRNAALKRDVDSLKRLVLSLEMSYVRANPDKPSELMLKNARSSFLGLAYIADHNPSPFDWMILHPKKAYSSQEHYGPAMSLAKSIYEERDLDVNNILREK